MCSKIVYTTKPAVIRAVKRYSKQFGYARYYTCPKCTNYHIASSSYTGDGYIDGRRINTPKSYYP